jgi:putative aminopeptidase FrvX
MLKDTKINTESIVNYIETLVKTPSPTGYTKQMEKYLIQNAEEKKIPYHQTKKGAVIYKFEAENAESSAMFAAHVDALGAIVKEVKKDSLTLSMIGGYPIMYVIGNYCTIHTFDGKTYEGTILPKNPAAHVNKELGKMKLDEFSKIEVRMDIKLKDEQDKLENYIEVGNFVSLDPHYSYVNGFVKSRHLDDKASAGVMLYVADWLIENSPALSQNIYLYFNITEETGQGISGFPEIDDFIVVDMGVVGEGVSGDEFNVSICAKDSSGPYNYDLTQSLIKIAKENEIGYKIDIFPYYGSDGSAALRAGGDFRVALIGPGVSASHGYERVHADSLTNTAKLMLGYIGG